MKNVEGLNPKESLDIISEAIQKTRENMKEQNFYYLLWGWIASIAAILNYIILDFTSFKYHWLPWAILMPLGGLISFLYAKNNNRHKNYETYIDLFLKYLWWVLGVSFILIVFISLMLNISPAILTLLIAGIGTLISGLTMKFKPLVLGGILFFVFSLTSIFVEDSTKLLINAIAIIIGYLIPAYILKRQ